MNAVSIATDIRYALRKLYAEGVAYPVTGHMNAQEISQVTGTVEGTPYGDIYQVGDVFTDPVGDNLLGAIFYVVESYPGDPTITLQQEISPGIRRPKVRLLDHLLSGEITEGERVHIGIRSRPTARYAVVRGFGTRRAIHDDEVHVFYTDTFWRGGIWLHVEGVDHLEVSYVFDAVNTGVRDLITDVYKLRVNLYPRQVQIINLEASGMFRNVLSADVTAALTAATPLEHLPDGLPPLYWPWDGVIGVSPVIEPFGLIEPLPVYAEKVGDYPLTEAAHQHRDDHPEQFYMPPTE